MALKLFRILNFALWNVVLVPGMSISYSSWTLLAYPARALRGRGPRPARPFHDHGTFSRLFREKPLCPCGGRRTGVKMAGGTARDAVGLLVRLRPWKSLALGAGHPKGPLIVASSTRVSFSALPPVPRAVPARQASSPGREEVRDGWTR